MATVTLEGASGSPTLQLDPYRSQSVVDELVRVRGSWLTRWVNELQAPRARNAPFAPEIRVIVREGSRVDSYEVFNGTVVRRVGERHHDQFFMGLQLLRWLYGPTP